MRVLVTYASSREAQPAPAPSPHAARGCGRCLEGLVRREPLSQLLHRFPDSEAQKRSWATRPAALRPRRQRGAELFGSGTAGLTTHAPPPLLRDADSGTSTSGARERETVRRRRRKEKLFCRRPNGERGNAVPTPAPTPSSPRPPPHRHPTVAARVTWGGGGHGDDCGGDGHLGHRRRAEHTRPARRRSKKGPAEGAGRRGGEARAPIAAQRGGADPRPSIPTPERALPRPTPRPMPAPRRPGGGAGGGERRGGRAGSEAGGPPRM